MKPFRHVWETDVKRLFHYEKFKAEYLSATLRDRKIHCSNPANFNDPWDCKPWFNYASIEDDDNLEKLFAFLRTKAGDDFDEKKADAYERMVRASRIERFNFLTGCSDENIRTINQRHIYCLTPDCQSTLMWSHYAENHKGICLEFGIDNPLFSLAIEVIYEKRYPVWMPYDFEEENDRAIRMILTKAWPWHYEREFRLISPFDKILVSPLRIDSGCFVLPPNSLKSVIAGCETDYDAVRAVVHAHMPDLPVKRATRMPDTFEIHVEG